MAVHALLFKDDVRFVSTPAHWMSSFARILNEVYFLHSWALHTDNKYMLAEIRLPCSTISCLKCYRGETYKLLNSQNTQMVSESGVSIISCKHIVQRGKRDFSHLSPQTQPIYIHSSLLPQLSSLSHPPNAPPTSCPTHLYVSRVRNDYSDRAL